MNTFHPALERYRAELRNAVEADLERGRSRRRTRTRVVKLGVPGLGVALGTSLTLVFAGSPAAFAGWSPSPTAASTQETSTADATCLAQLTNSPSISPGVTPGSGWSVVATDIRGPFALVVFQNGSSGATCLTGPSVTIVSQNNGRSMSVSHGSPGRSGSGRGTRVTSGGSSSVLSTGSSGSLAHITLTHLDSSSQGSSNAFTFIEGQVDDGVTGVTLVLSDGEHVQATTGDGWILAWWPGDLNATAADIAAVSGTSTQTLTPTTPPRPSLPSATGNSGAGA